MTQTQVTAILDHLTQKTGYTINRQFYAPPCQEWDTTGHGGAELKMGEYSSRTRRLQIDDNAIRVAKDEDSLSQGQKTFLLASPTCLSDAARYIKNKR